MTELTALLFDFDGTIAETERDGHRVAYNTAFEEAGAVWHWDVPTYGELLSTAGGKERLERFIRRESPDLARTDRAELIALLYDSKRRHFERLADSLALRPGIARILDEARRAGLRCVIATTAAPSGVEAVLRRDPKLANAFDFIAAGDIVSAKKPAPDIYLYALEKLGLPASAALAIEDSAIGLHAATAAGLATLVTPSAYNAHERFVGAAAIVEDLGEPGGLVTTIAGPTPPRGYVDLAYLRDVHARAAAPARRASQDR